MSSEDVRSFVNIMREARANLAENTENATGSRSGPASEAEEEAPNVAMRERSGRIKLTSRLFLKL